MKRRDVRVEENAFLELTDGELEEVGGGSPSNSFWNAFKGSYINLFSTSSTAGAVTQIAYASSTFSSTGITLQGNANASPTVGSSSQASNYYNYSVGNVGQ